MKSNPYSIRTMKREEIDIAIDWAAQEGWKVAPLLADSPELAEQLFLALKSEAKPVEAVFLDVPEVNPAAVVLAERHQSAISFETARMYTGKTPGMPLNRLFGVTSFEIG